MTFLAPALPSETAPTAWSISVLGASLQQQQRTSYVQLPVNCNKGCHIPRQCEEYFIRCHALATWQPKRDAFLFTHAIRCGSTTPATLNQLLLSEHPYLAWTTSKESRNLQIKSPLLRPFLGPTFADDRQNLLSNQIIDSAPMASQGILLIVSWK